MQSLKRIGGIAGFLLKGIPWMLAMLVTDLIRSIPGVVLVMRRILDPNKKSNAMLTSPDWLFQLNILKTFIFISWQEWGRQIHTGGEAKDVTLHMTDEKSDGAECKLLDFMRPNRPLVLNFGSNT